ncbi:MAG: hypothetical protein QW598_01470 [Pyrobaculum sp.]
MASLILPESPALTPSANYAAASSTKPLGVLKVYADPLLRYTTLTRGR